MVQHRAIRSDREARTLLVLTKIDTVLEQLEQIRRNAEYMLSQAAERGNGNGVHCA